MPYSNHSQDHGRLQVRIPKHSLSLRLQVGACLTILQMTGRDSRNTHLQDTLQSKLLAARKRKQQLMSGPPEETQRIVHQTIMVLDGEISEVGDDILEASEELKKLTVERRKAEVEGLRVSDTARVVVSRDAVSGAQSSEGEAGLAGQRCPGEHGVAVDQRASLGTQLQ